MFIVVRLIAVCYVSVCLFMYLMQSQFIFFPTKDLIDNPANAGLKHTDVNFKASDGVKLHGWAIYAENPIGWLIYCHGNGGNISFCLYPIEAYVKSSNLNVFVFDYRGFGKSEGSPSEKGIYLDAQAAYDYVVNNEKADPKKTIILGWSLGGGVACELAHKNQCAALVLESTFTSLPDLAQKIYWYLPARYLARYKFDNKSKISDIKVPKLFSHGVMDRVIPYELGKELYESSAEPKEFVDIPGDHNESDRMNWPDYIAAWKRMLQSAGIADPANKD